ncbi:MAG TPA: DMT family transporter [Gemmatimonadales bacterium]
MTHRRAVLLLVLTTVIWGVSITAVKALMLHVTPMLAVAVRFGLAGVLLLPLLGGLTRQEVRAGLWIGLLFAAGVAFQNLGLAITTPSRNAFIVSLSALLTPAVGALALAHRVPVPLVIRILIAMGGVFVLTSPEGTLSAINRGDLLTLVSAILYAGQIVAVGHFARSVSAPRLLCLQFLLTAATGLMLAPVLETPRLEAGLTTWLLVAALATSSLLTFGFQLRSQRVVTASEAALIFTFEPVVTAVTSYLVFGEVLTPIQWMGAAAIMLSVGWPARGTKQEVGSREQGAGRRGTDSEVASPLPPPASP